MKIYENGTWFYANNEYNIKCREYTQLFIHIIIYTYQYTHKLREGATV
jgi:hypothetical protein